MVTKDCLAQTSTYAPTVLYGSQRWQRTTVPVTIYQQLPFYAVVAVIDGRHRITLGQQQWLLESGQIAILGPGQQWVHQVAPGSRLLYAVGILIHRSLTWFPQNSLCMKQLPGQAVQPDPMTIWGVSLPVIPPVTISKQVFQDLKMVCDFWWRSPLARLRANHAFGDIFLRCVLTVAVDSPNSTSRHPSDPLISQALSLLDNGALPGSAQAWADRLGLHRNGFERRFKKVMNDHPGSYLRRHRIGKAQRMLEESSVPLVIVAAECGYASAAAMASAFHRLTGCSPSRWRRERQHPSGL